MQSLRSKLTLLTLGAILVALGVATAIGVISIRKLGRNDADQMIHLTATTGAMNLESYFESVEHSVDTVSTLVSDSFGEMTMDELDGQVERARNLFGRVANNTNGVLTYYFRIDPEVSDTVKGFWYVKEGEKGFVEHEVTDISQYDTGNTSALVWFTIPKATGDSIWLSPYYTENLDVQVISYNIPVYWQERFVGVIGIEIDYEILAEEVEKVKIFDTGYAFILDEDSNVIYHPQVDSAKLDLEMTSLSDTDRFIGSNHVQYKFMGVEKEAVWIPLSNGMRFFVSAPESEIDSGWHGMIKNMLIASVLVLAVVNVVMLIVTERLTKPLRELTEAAVQADDGNYDFTLDYDKDDEIGILTRSFKQLVAHTKAHISDLNKQVYVDALTRVRNKAGYGEYIQQLQDKIDGGEEQFEFAFGVFDCDDLKHINDTYGHEKGDLYLKAASRMICRTFQHSPVFRIGGDEFAVILMNEDYENRGGLIEAFLKARAESCENAANEWEKVSVTMGVAVYDPDADASVIDVARRADQRMYENKQARKEAQKKGERQGRETNTARQNL